jgi:hypothetical protein
MDCIILQNGVESALHRQLIELFGQEVADKKMTTFMSDEFIERFGDYKTLQANKSDFIPPKFAGRLNETYEPKIDKDDSGYFWLDAQFSKQYIDTVESKLYDILKSQRAINSLVEILASNHLDEVGFNLEFDSLDSSSVESNVVLSKSINTKLASLSAELMRSDNMTFKINGIGLVRVSKDDAALQELSYKVKQLFKARKFEYKEDGSANEPEVHKEESLQRDQIVSKSSVEINPKSKIGALVKLRLSLIKNPNDIDLDFGQPKPIDFHVLYNKLTNILKDSPAIVKDGKAVDSFKTIINKISAHVGNVKYASNLVAYLEKLDRLKPAKGTSDYIKLQQLKAGIVKTFNLQKNKFATKTIISKEIDLIPAVKEKVELPNGTIHNKTIKEAVKGKEYTYETKDAVLLSNTRKDTLLNWEISFLEYFNFPKKPTDQYNNKKLDELIDIRKKIDLLIANKSIKNSVKAFNLVKMMNSIGIDISEEALVRALNINRNKPVSPLAFEENSLGFIKNTKDAFDNAIQHHSSKTSLFNYYWYGQIAEATVFYSEDGSESSILTAGKNKYLFSNPSYLNNKINTWKEDPSSLQKEYDELGAWEQGSNLYKYLLALEELNVKERAKLSAERIATLSIETFNSYRDMSDKNSKQKDIKELTKNEDVKDTVNGLLYSKTKIGELTHGRGTTAPGKSTQVEVVHGLFVESGIALTDMGNIITRKAEDVLFNYLYSEFQRMSEAYAFIEKKTNEKKLDMYYHFKEGKPIRDEDGKIIKGNLGNAFKSQLFPSLSFDKIDSRRLGLLEDIYDENGKVILANVDGNKEVIKAHIRQSIISELEVLKNNLIKANIIEVAGKEIDKATGKTTKKTIYNNKGIDTRILSAYNKGNQITEAGLVNLMGDLFLNGLVNQTEYSKVFAGDIAYYKNEVDYIKRIGPNLSDGSYQYLDDTTKEFRVGVTDPIEYVEPYLNELREIIQSDPVLLKSWEDTINVTDGQAWITIERWKTIMEGIGNFSEKHQSVYEKIIGKNSDPIDPSELKLVAQPLKGVYFFRDSKGKPIFMKYSQAVIIPQLANNPIFYDMLELMKTNKLDELVTLDAMKVGALRPTKIHTEEGTSDVRDKNGKIKKMNVMTLDSRGWKLQQDLPTKTFKETDTGSQLLNNMLVLMADKLDSKQAEFEHGGKEYTALEYAKLIDNTLGKYIEMNYASFMSEFNIDPTSGIIYGVDKFYNMLADELESREYSDEVVKAIRAKLSIAAMPAFEGKLQSIFSAIVKDRVNKIKTNGGAFIQMAPHGFSKEELDSKHPGVKWSPNVGMVHAEGEWKWENGHHVKPYTYKLNEDGTRAKSIFGRDIIVPEQILISGSFIAKYVPDYETKSSAELFGVRNPKTGELEGGLIDKKILNTIIGYRIPNQGPSSNGALEVVGILPPGMGDVVVAFTGITKKTGGDYDIDKLYIMFPNYKAKYRSADEIVKKAEEFIQKNKIGKKEMLQDLAYDNIPVADNIDFKILKANYISQILLESDNSFYAEEFRSRVKDKEVIGLEYIDSKENTKKGIQNRIIELYKGLILHPDNVMKTMTPLDHVYVKDDAQNLAPAKPKGDLATFSFIEDINTKYSYLDGLLGVGMEANAGSEYGRGSMADVYYEGVALGKRSNEGETISVEIQTDDGPIDIEKVHTRFDRTRSVELTSNELKSYVASYNKRAPADKQMDYDAIANQYKSFPISDTLSALMNAFVDIAKDPYITNINWNSITTNTGNMLIRAGVHPFVTLAFLAQPIISEYINFTKTYDSKSRKFQVSDSKNAFKIFRVGDLIKRDATTLLTDPEKYGIIQMNDKTIYEVVTASLGKDLDLLKEEDFVTDKVVALLMELNGVKHITKLKPEQREEIKTNLARTANSIIRKHRIFFQSDFKDENDIINTDLYSLREGIFKNDLKFQADAFTTFIKYASHAKKLKASLEASSYDVNGYGKNTTSLLMAAEKIDTVIFKGVLNYDTKLKHSDGTLKLLGHRQQYTIDNTIKIVQSNPLIFPSAAPSVWNTFNYLSTGITGDTLQDEDLGDALDKAFKTYLMAGFEPFNLNREESIDLITNFPDEFSNFKANKENLERYYILQELTIKETLTRRYVGLNNKTNSKEYTDKMINSWRELLKYHPEIAEKLVKYSFITSGFNNSTISFMQYIPPTFFFQNDFNGYVDRFSKRFDKTSYDKNFSDHFYLSNLDNPSIVKNVKEFAINKDNPYSQAGKVLRKNVYGEYINIEHFDEEGNSVNIYYKSLGLDSKGNNVYTKYTPVKGGYAQIKSLTVEDKKNGVSIYNYNVDGINLPVDKTIDKKTTEMLDAMYELYNLQQIKVTSIDEFNQETVRVREEIKIAKDRIDNMINKYPEFTKLPKKSENPTMFYAGIGSRETPEWAQKLMTELAKKLEARGFTLRSGGAKGADAAFEKGVKSKKVIFPGGTKAGAKEHIIAREIHPRPQALDNSKNPEFVWNLMARNTNQIFGENLDTPVDFVVAWTQDALEDHRSRTEKSGGTGQAIEMASRKGIPVFNMENKNWEQMLDSYLDELVVTAVVEETEDKAEESISEEIYNELGDKTLSENVELIDWPDLKEFTKAIEVEPNGNIDAIVSTRIPNTNQHFGNPFSHKPEGKTKGLIKTDTIKEAVEKYIDWIVNPHETELPFNLKEVKPKAKQDILNSLTKAESSGHDIGYYYFKKEYYLFSSHINNFKTEKEAISYLEEFFNDKDIDNKITEKLKPALNTQQEISLFKRREWIREQLKSGKLKGKPILYYKELKEPSHATALDYLINKYDLESGIIKDKKSFIDPNQISLFEDVTKSKTFNELKTVLEFGGHDVFKELDIKTVEDLEKLNEDELGKLLKKICK